MSIQRIDSDTQKPKALRFFEGALLIICLCVLALRATYTESPYTHTINPDQFLTNQAFSIIISSLLLLLPCLWLIVSALKNHLPSRLTGIEIPILGFIAAAAIGIYVASNKRLAVNDTVTLLAPLLAAVMLAHILNTKTKLDLVMLVIVSLAFATSIHCFEQYFADNEDMIRQYEQDPQKFLDTIGAQPGTLKEFQFKHRLYSKDIRGFLTTSNSTGSFLVIAAFVSVAMFIEKLKHLPDPDAHVTILLHALMAVVIVSGLIISKSKGALVAAFVSAIMFTAWLAFRGTIYKYRKQILIFAIIALIAVTFITINYGTTHKRLPGGNSMLVRWQYWTGAAQMYAEHPLTGVGGGNFADHYTKYKIPAAPETVKDPHNFLLSILTQYGPLGLAAMLAAIAIPLYKTVFKTNSANQPLTPASPNPKLNNAALITIIASLLLIRPYLIGTKLTGPFIDVSSAILILYLLPAILFAIAFLIFRLTELKSVAPSQATISYSVTKAALTCSIIGVLIHNLIDFAIFEPAVLTLFWITISCLIAMNFNESQEKSFVNGPPRFLIPVTSIALFLSVLLYSLIPTVNSGLSLQRAMRPSRNVPKYLSQAAQDDPLDPLPYYTTGRMLIDRYQNILPKDPAFLQSAVNFFLAAAEKETQSFKNYEKLADCYAMLAENAPATEKKDLLNTACDYAAKAISLYPGSDRIHLKLATIADHAENFSLALEHYKKTVEIEDSYREQFHLMYPSREIFSRLGPSNYQLAKDRIKELENRWDKPSEN